MPGAVDTRKALFFRPRAFAVAACFGVALSTAFIAPTASAQNAKVEAAAKALQKKAMEEDYLTTEFGKAQDKLDKAIAQCGTDKCSAGVRAALRRDMGVVQIGGQIDKEKGISNFVEALKLDPAIQLDNDLKTKELEAAFAEAKKRAGGGGGGGGGAAGGGGSGGQPQGDFSHTPAAEQQIRTPVPVYVEYGGEEALGKVIARYKGFGMTEWKTVELKKMGEKGWGGLIGGTPQTCGDVQQGSLQYYVQGFNANNDPVATGGDRNNPYKVPIAREKVAEPPHLPNGTPPTQCADTGDCPPNFPGCKKVTAKPDAPTEPVGKDGGEFCEEDNECKSNKCSDNKCTDFDGGEKKGKRFWVGITGALDYTFVPSADDVCKLKTADALPQNDSNYYCTVDGRDYPYRPGEADPAENDRLVASSDRGSNRVSGGGALGNIRLMASLDYAATPNILVGGRIGLVINNYPGEAAGVDGKRFSAPLHLELRGTYLFGKDPLSTKGFAPYVMFGAGAAQFETSVKVQVVENTANGRVGKEVEAWHLAGPVFVAFGGGGRLALSERFALIGGLRANLALGNSFALSVGPELGAQVGF